MDILKGLFQKAQNFTNDIIGNKYYSAFVTILTIFGIATNLVIPDTKMTETSEKLA